MNEIIVSRLLKIANKLNTKVFWCDQLNKYTPPAASPKFNSIVMNTNWYKKSEIPFQLAHELAHIINKDPDNVAFYHATFKGKSYYELAANEKAISILVSIYFRDTEKNKAFVFDFMENLCIPAYLEKKVAEKIKFFYE